MCPGSRAAPNFFSRGRFLFVARLPLILARYPCLFAAKVCFGGYRPNARVFVAPSVYAQFFPVKVKFLPRFVFFEAIFESVSDSEKPLFFFLAPPRGLSLPPLCVLGDHHRFVAWAGGLLPAAPSYESKGHDVPFSGDQIYSASLFF